jgi:mRNA-degrading endonuclease RelE of RelBE toxin-antitoxin system
VNIEVTKEFTRNLKKLVKKDRELIQEFEDLISTLKDKPNSGKHLGNGRYKIRVKNNSNNKGKSGGYRIITYTKIEDTILLVYIYSKSDTESIADNKIDNIIKNYKI